MRTAPCAHEGRSPEARFRFADRCVEGVCRQWTCSRCGVVDRVAGEAAAVTDSALAVTGSPLCCGIRPRCRWFAQSGVAACALCDFVVTEAARADQPEIARGVDRLEAVA